MEHGHKCNNRVQLIILKFIIIFLLFNFSGSNLKVSAHEMFYSKSATGTWVPVPLKWGIINSGVATLKVSTKLLSASYTPYIAEVMSSWDSMLNVYVKAADFSVSNVDFATGSKTYWDNEFKEYSQSVLAVTHNTSTDGILLDTLSAAQRSSKLVKHSGIILTPYVERFASISARKKTMVHEIGHSLCLGHPDVSYYPTTAASIMKQGYHNYYTPQSHDKNDIASKY